MDPLYFLIAIPFFILGMAIEFAVSLARRKKLYRFHDTVTNLNIGIGMQAFNLFFKVLFVGAYVAGVKYLALIHLPEVWWMFVPAMLVYDFVFYWGHRWSHEVNFWWGAHVVHHTSEEFNLSVALRQSWFLNLLAFVLFFPIVLLGIPPSIFVAAAAFHTIYQFWIHTEAIPKLWKPFEFIFNSPSHHRVHHGRNPKYIDKNHGGVLIIWDRIFGTYQEEEESPTYGITTPLNSWNPAWANIHYYVEMAAAMKRMKRWQDKLRYFVARPGWLPAYLGGKQPVPEVDGQNVKKYETRVSGRMNIYIGAQLLLVVGALAAFMYHFAEMGWGFRLIFLSGMILSLTICGALMEHRKWIIVAEYVRLVLVLACMNAYYWINENSWFLLFFVASTIVFALLVFWFTRMVILREAVKVEEA